jgi:hypothetical protein
MSHTSRHSAGAIEEEAEIPIFSLTGIAVPTMLVPDFKGV